MTMAFPNAGPVTLRTNFADYPNSRALKAGEIKSDLVTFDFCGPKVANQGFKPMVREGKFDAGELAIATFLQAKVYGKPLVLLPATVMGRSQHHTIVYNTQKGELTPRNIEGRKVGIRSYTQTTGIWVRGILQHEYGVDLSKVTFVCNDDPHLAEYKDPDFVVRTPPGSRKVDEMLLEGELDAGIVGGDTLADSRVKPLIKDPQAAGAAWCRKHGTVPINHMFVVSKALADTRPDVVREIFRLLQASKDSSPPAKDGFDYLPMGVEANRKPLELIIAYAYEQKIIPRRFTVDELFDDTTRALGA
jgi:4,5-dihydroxyphthalate decarboxylase